MDILDATTSASPRVRGRSELRQAGCESFDLKSKLPPEEVASLIKEGALVVDLRSRIEAIFGKAPGATNIPLSALKRRMDELPRDRNIVLYCGTGARAGKAKA